MTAAATAGQPGSGAPPKPAERRAFAVACGAHALHDGYTDIVSVMLPIWRAEFGLSYAAVGLLRGGYSAMMAGFQLPAGVLSERYGAAVILAGGTALAALGFCLAGTGVGLPTLAGAILIAGLGSSTQHPIASMIVARAFAGPRSLKALGGYNFSGDIGKMILPAATAFLVTVMPWRPALLILGGVGLMAAAAIAAFAPRVPQKAVAESGGEPSAAAETQRARYFPLLLAIGIVDSMTRAGFLTFLPFLLLGKGATISLIGIALTLVFAGGAAGKLACGYIGARIGPVRTVWLTEILTAAGIVALLPLPLEATFLLLLPLGIALNGTSSVLYGSVPDLVAPSRRARAFGIFYTGTIGAGALAPMLYGLAGDAFGIAPTLAFAAALLTVTLPLAWLLRPAFAERAR